MESHVHLAKPLFCNDAKMSTHQLSLFSDQPPSFLTIGTGTQGRKSTPQPIVQRKVLDRCIIGFAVRGHIDPPQRVPFILIRHQR